MRSGAVVGEAMTPSDAILWRIEHDPVLRSTVTAVCRLDRAPDADRLRRRVQEVVGREPRLRQVVAEPPFGLGPPRWRPAPEVDLDDHLRWIRLPAERSGFDDVLELAAHQTMAGFDRTRPLWELTVVDDVDGGAALIQRFHHAVTDGIGGMRLALELLDTERGGGRPAGGDRPRGPRASDDHLVTLPRPPDGGGGPSLPRLVARTLEDGVARSVAVPRFLGQAALRAGRSPQRSLAEAFDTLRWGARLVAPVAAPLSPVMRARSTRLAFAAFDVDLPRLHAAAREAGGTLNDAFVAGVGGGLRRYHRAIGHPVDRLRITLPVSIRRPDDAAMVNRFTPVRFEVPLVPAEPALLVPVIGSIIRQWRQGPALGLSDAMATVLSVLPAPALAGVFGALLRNVDFVATNVPGLAAPAYLAGARVDRQYAFAPPSGAAVNVAMLSHVGQSCIGVNMDRAAVSRPDVLVRSLREGLEEVLALVPATGPVPGDRGVVGR